jgi:hypothetical protein
MRRCKNTPGYKESTFEILFGIPSPVLVPNSHLVPLLPECRNYDEHTSRHFIRTSPVHPRSPVVSPKQNDTAERDSISSHYVCLLVLRRQRKKTHLRYVPRHSFQSRHEVRQNVLWRDLPLHSLELSRSTGHDPFFNSIRRIRPCYDARLVRDKMTCQVQNYSFGLHLIVLFLRDGRFSPSVDMSSTLLPPNLTTAHIARQQSRTQTGSQHASQVKRLNSAAI